MSTFSRSRAEQLAQLNHDATRERGDAPPPPEHRYFTFLLDDATIERAEELAALRRERGELETVYANYVEVLRGAISIGLERLEAAERKRCTTIPDPPPVVSGEAVLAGKVPTAGRCELCGAYLSEHLERDRRAAGAS